MPNIQPDLETLHAGRARYGDDSLGLIAAPQVVALEFATVVAANDCWR